MLQEDCWFYADVLMLKCFSVVHFNGAGYISADLLALLVKQQKKKKKQKN